MAVTQPKTEPATPFTSPVPLTRPPVLIALTAAIVLLGLGILAAATAQVSTSVTGQGVVLSGGYMTPVVTGTAGQVQQLNVAVGDRIQAGQPVAVIRGEDREASTVRAQSAGLVTQVDVVPGEVIPAGQPVAQIVDNTQPLLVTTFVPVAQGDGIQIGMPAHVHPAGSNANSAAYVGGTVHSIDQFVADATTIASAVGNESLARSITAAGPVRAIEIAFPGSPTNPADLTWTGGSAAAVMGNGSLVTVDVVTGEESLFTLLTSGR